LRNELLDRFATGLTNNIANEKDVHRVQGNEGGCEMSNVFDFAIAFRWAFF